MFNYPAPQFMQSIPAPEPGKWPPPTVEPADSRSGPHDQIYIHVPFCPFICDYCLFYKIRNQSQELHERFTDLLIREIEYYGSSLVLREREFGVIYFGGGTPTELTPAQLKRIVAALHKHFRIHPQAEVTLEAVARHLLAPGYLEECLEVGFNRLSFGIQSLDERVRQAIGRTGDVVADYPRAIEHARRLAPQVPVNIEFINSLPEQDESSVRMDLEQAIAWDAASIDLFSYLMIPGTPLYQKILLGKSAQPRYGAALVSERRMSRQLLEDAGYRQVGGGMYSKHDRSFYSQSFYDGHAATLALGPSSIGRIGDTTYRNAGNLDEYAKRIGAGRFPVTSAMRMTRNQVRRRALLLAIGHFEIPRELVATSRERRCFARWRKHGLVEPTADGWRLTGEGHVWYNQMQMELLPVLDFLHNLRLLGSVEEQDLLIRSGSPLGQELLTVAGSYGTLPASVMRWGYRWYLRAAQWLPRSWTSGVGWLGPTRRLLRS
jgi:coproporphyrinogen III oxidase-like Fe-S oxidoreductase